MFTWLPVLFITHVIKLSVISELVWSLSCYSLNFSPSNDQTTEHGELNDLPEASGYQRVFLILPRILSYPALVENVLFSVAPSASVLLGCPTKCCKLQTRVHTCTPPPISGLHGYLLSMSLTEPAAKALVQDWEG